MAIYKDDKTWTVQCRIKNRDGTTKQHKKLLQGRIKKYIQAIVAGNQ